MCPCVQATDQGELVQLRAEVAMLTEATRGFDSTSLSVQLADAVAERTAWERDALRLEGELQAVKKNVGAQAVCLEGNYLPSAQEKDCEALLRVAEENATRLAIEASRREERLRGEAAQAVGLRDELAAAKAALGEAEANAEQLGERTAFQEEMLAKRAAEVGALTRELAAMKAALRLAEEAANQTQTQAVAPSAAAEEEAAEKLRAAREEAESARAEAVQLEERLAGKASEAMKLEQKLAASNVEVAGLTKRLAAAKAVRLAEANASAGEEGLGGQLSKRAAPEGCKGLALELADARAALRVAEGPAVSTEAACGCNCDDLARELADAKAAIEVSEAFPASSHPVQSATEWESIVRDFVGKARVLYLELREGKFGDPSIVGLAVGCCAAALAWLCCCCGGLLLDSGGF